MLKGFGTLNLWEFHFWSPCRGALTLQLLFCLKFNSTCTFWHYRKGTFWMNSCWWGFTTPTTQSTLVFCMVIVSQTKGLYRGCWTRPKQSLAAPCPVKETANTVNLSKDSAIIRDCTAHTKGAICFICCPQIGTADDLKLDIHCLFVCILYAKQLASWCIWAEKHTLKLFLLLWEMCSSPTTPFYSFIQHSSTCWCASACVLNHDRVQD